MEDLQGPTGTYRDLDKVIARKFDMTVAVSILKRHKVKSNPRNQTLFSSTFDKTSPIHGYVTVATLEMLLFMKILGGPAEQVLDSGEIKRVGTFTFYQLRL